MRCLTLVQVKGTDRGVLLPEDGHQEVADLALQLGKYCIDEPVKSPLIFGGKINSYLLEIASAAVAIATHLAHCNKQWVKLVGMSQ